MKFAEDWSPPPENANLPNWASADIAVAPSVLLSKWRDAYRRWVIHRLFAQIGA